MSDNSGMGEQAINKIAEAGLRTQLDEVEALTVNVDISPEAIAGGEIDAVTIEGEGLVLQDDLRTEKLRVKTGPIAITPWKAVFGNIELKQTVKAQAEITLTEQDINDALNLDYLKGRFKALQLQVDGQSTAVKPSQVQFGLPGGGRARWQADVELVDIDQRRHVVFSAVPVMGANGHQIEFEQIIYEDNYEASGDTPGQLVAALIDSACELLDLRNFELEGMTLKLSGLAVEVGQLTLKAQASVQEFPGD